MIESAMLGVRSRSGVFDSSPSSAGGKSTGELVDFCVDNGGEHVAAIELLRVWGDGRRKGEWLLLLLLLLLLLFVRMW